MRKQYKITHLSDNHPATDERIFFKAAKYAAAAGYTVSICGLHPRNGTLDGIEMIAVKKVYNKIAKLLSSVTVLLPIALKCNSNIYQFHDPGLLLLGLLLRLSGKKVIYDIHEDYEQKLLTRLPLHPLLRKSIAKLWWFIEYSVSTTFNHLVVADSHIQQKFCGCKTTIIPNVPGKAFWESCVRTRFDNEIRLVYVGTITRDRGIQETIAALKYINHDRVSFHIYGKTEDQFLIDLLNSDNRIHWHGFVKWDELASQLANADIGTVLLQPVSAYSYYTGENIVKLWEYMSLGLPVIISDFPALQDLCSQVGFGIAVDPTDPCKIAEAIDYLIDHPEERKQYSKNGMQYVRTEYNADVKLKALINVYDDLLGIQIPL